MVLAWRPPDPIGHGTGVLTLGGGGASPLSRHIVAGAICVAAVREHAATRATPPRVPAAWGAHHPVHRGPPGARFGRPAAASPRLSSACGIGTTQRTDDPVPAARYASPCSSANRVAPARLETSSLP